MERFGVAYTLDPALTMRGKMQAFEGNCSLSQNVLISISDFSADQPGDRVVYLLSKENIEENWNLISKAIRY